jgi:hypothetical protein
MGSRRCGETFPSQRLLSHGLGVTAELEGKTAGWVASHAALERELTARLGITLVVD